MTRRSNRRTFLRGLGGAVVAAPFLGSLGGRGAKAQAVEPPKRLIAMFTHLGCITTRFFPAKSHGALTAEDLAPTTLRHLTPFVDKLLIPRGIRGMNEWTADLERGQGNDPHTQVVGSYFTCQPVTPNSDEPFSFDTATKFNAKPTGASLDHVIAQQLSPKGVPLFLRVGNRNDSPQSAISYSAAEMGFSGIGSPTEAFSELTGLFRGSLSPDSYQAIRGQSILDLVKDDLETLERFDMSQSDRRKLEAWKELLHETGTLITSEQCNEAVATELGATPTNAAAFATGIGSDNLGMSITSTMDGADLYSSIAALSAACNTNPVIFLKYPTSYVFAALGLTIDSHSLSHRIGNAGMSGACVTGVIDMLSSIDDYYARKFARLVGLLDSINEGEGTVLDNSATVWFQEMSDGSAHNLNNLPIIQVGSAGGFFKTGRAVNVEDGSADLTPGNSEYYCTEGGPLDVDGIAQTTGTASTLANAPINKYFVSLMNALHVRAGEDGFPSVTGQTEVTKFGRYDRTEDFVGGSVNPPMIHSPGGFDALEA